MITKPRVGTLSLQSEDYRALLFGLCVANWCAAALALAVQLLIRSSPDYEWPRWGNFTWTYNLVLLEYVLVNLGLTVLLRDTAWLDRAPRQALGRLRLLLLSVLVLDGLHYIGFFHLTGGVHGPMAILMPAGIMTIYLILSRRDANLVNGVFLIVLLLTLLAYGSGSNGMLAPAFDASQGPILPWSLVAGAGILGALFIGAIASGQMERAGISLQHRARYDPQTLLFTREVLESRIPGELGRIGRSRSSAALLMVEFRNLGDLLPQGDLEVSSQIVREFAANLRAVTRSTEDTCAQYGIGTFALLLPEASADSAVEVAKRIQSRADQICIPPGNDQGIRLAVGIAVTVAEHGASSAQLVEVAQTALREAGEAGPGHQIATRET